MRANNYQRRNPYVGAGLIVIIITGIAMMIYGISGLI